MNLAVTEFLAPYSSEVRNLALKIRALVLEVMPNAVEQVDPPSKIIAYGVGLKMADIVCVIAPYRSHVNLMFRRGTELADPKWLLTGTGKHARHVRISKADEVDAPALHALLDAAVAMQE